jgi:hypothetical protein
MTSSWPQSQLNVGAALTFSLTALAILLYPSIF